MRCKKRCWLKRHKSSAGHSSLLTFLGSQRLCFCSGSKLRWNRADKQRFQSELEHNCPHVTPAPWWAVVLGVCKVVVCIDLVMRICNWLELKIQLQDFVQVAQTLRIYFQFDHNSREGSGPAVSAQLFSISLVCTKRKAAIKDVHLKE